MACRTARTGFSVKNASAVSAVMFSTSLMDCPRSCQRSTSGRKRWPSQTSQVVERPSMNARSVYTTPSPAQFGQLPSELKLNSAGL